MNSVDFLIKVWGYHARPGYYFVISTKHHDLWKDYFIQWSDNEQATRREIKRVLDRKADNTYFCPNPYRSKHRRITEAIGSSYLWSDLDEVNPRVCSPRPTVAWRSSPNRYSGLWHRPRLHAVEQSTRDNRSLTYEIGADKGGWDYTQVLRLPGTRNSKYKSKPVVKLLWFKDKPINYRAKQKAKEERQEASKESVEKIIARYRKKFSSKLKSYLNATTTRVGERSHALWYMEHEMLKIGMSVPEAIAVLKQSVWNKYKGRNDEDERFTSEFHKILENELPDSVEDENKEDTHSSIVRLADVQPESVSWLWYPYIPRGKLTIMEGDPGLGKSWISIALASYISLKRRLPNQQRPASGRIMLMSAEDGLGDTIRPRLDSLGANVNKIFAYIDPVTLDEEGVKDVEAQIAEIRPSLVVIDPLVAYFGGRVDLHKANETREVMARLAIIAERYGCAILGVRHLTKGGRDKSIYRGIGSIDLTAAARSVLHVGQDPEDEESRVIVHIKSNLAELGPSIRYVLRPGNAHPFRWAGTTRLKAVDLAQSDKDMSKEGGRVEQFLKQQLTKDTPAETIRRNAEAKGISPRSLRRARDRLNVEADKINGQWVWRKINVEGSGSGIQIVGKKKARTSVPAPTGRSKKVQ